MTFSILTAEKKSVYFVMLRNSKLLLYGISHCCGFVEPTYVSKPLGHELCVCGGIVGIIKAGQQPLMSGVYEGVGPSDDHQERNADNFIASHLETETRIV